jgi:hypothetical protein
MKVDELYFVPDPNMKQISYGDKVDYIKKNRNGLSTPVVGDNELDMMVYEIKENFIFHGYTFAKSIDGWYFELINMKHIKQTNRFKYIKKVLG